ncbi:hypothetical protein [Streptomyces sp. NPDC018031]|uniref:hypothetical protein n=1 Tax=Streptomyces sp. NPDC018031 TaxID=3365033 RepID=UPI0037B0101B
MVRRRVRRVAFAVGIAAAALALPGCGSDSPDSGDGTPRIAEDRDVPPLPLDRYQFADDEYARYRQAQARLVQRCMVGLGFTDFPLDPREPGRKAESTATVTMAGMDSPFGSLDLDRARRWGYGHDPAQRAGREPEGRRMTDEEYRVLNGMTRAGREADGRTVPQGGCYGQAERELTGGLSLADYSRAWSYTGGRAYALQKAMDRDDRIRTVWRTWSDCLADKGFKRYRKPADAFADRAWGRGEDGNTTRGERERATAAADVECKRRHNTAGEWWAVAVEKQRAELARRKATYEDVRRDIETIRANVRHILAGG